MRRILPLLAMLVACSTQPRIENDGSVCAEARAIMGGCGVTLTILQASECVGPSQAVAECVVEHAETCEDLAEIRFEQCADDVLDPVTDDFDARFSATARTYRYRILNHPQGDPFIRHLSWHVIDTLDVAAMRAGAAHLVGEHDFASFCRKRLVVIDGEEREADLTREVHRIDIEHTRELMDVWLTANAFCHQMVRAITGTLVEVGRGRRDADSVPATLAARDRAAAGALAPPRGLTLWSVAYE